MSSNKSILEFFKPKQAVGSGTSSSRSSQFNAPAAVRSGNAPRKSMRDAGTNASFHSGLQSPVLGVCSSSPPPSSGASEQFHTPPEDIDSPITGPLESPRFRPYETAQQSCSPSYEVESPPQGNQPNPATTRLSRDRVIKNSDDEDSDSSDFQDLSTLFGTKSSATRPAPAKTFSTPKRSRSRNFFNFPSSPLTVQPKPKYDLKTLIRQRDDEEALEISSKRIKAMLVSRTENEGAGLSSSKDVPNQGILNHEVLLDSMMAEGGNGEAYKVKRALNRTEAAILEMHWSFFDLQNSTSRRPEHPFPTGSVPESWNNEFSDPEMRYHTFVSGFAQDMVGLGKVLPDELFLWILDELCWEESDLLRTAYADVLHQSTEQVNRLIHPTRIRELFRNLGGSLTATLIMERVQPLPRFSELHSNQEWPNLLTALKFLTDIANDIQQESRTYIISLILRMSVDRVVLTNVDLFQVVQSAITGLCQGTVDDEWEEVCQEICKTLFSTVELPTLRRQLLESISSTTPRSHDLRRRLAMCFFFNDINYSTQHSYDLADLEKFISRLEESDFEVTAETDYRELSALISLLDIAVDDGCSTNIDYHDKAVEKKFNEKVDELSETIKNVMRYIGNPGASFLSKLDAKRNLDLVEKRISETIRSKAKPKHSWFDGSSGQKEEDLDAEKQGMKIFVSKMRNIGNGSNGENRN